MGSLPSLKSEPKRFSRKKSLANYCNENVEPMVYYSRSPTMSEYVLVGFIGFIERGF